MDLRYMLEESLKQHRPEDYAALKRQGRLKKYLMDWAANVRDSLATEVMDRGRGTRACPRT